MTILQAVNICLSSMGEPEIDTLDGAGLDAEAAENLIQETSASVQIRGFWFNREIHQLAPSGSGHLLIPANSLSIDTTGLSADLDLIQRGSKLFDRKNNTYVFTAPVEVEIVACLPWDDLPPAARLAIATLAASTLQERLLSSDALTKQLTARAKEAMAMLIRDDLRASDANMLRDSWSVGRALRRGAF
jgi:hypothetical protein